MPPQLGLDTCYVAEFIKKFTDCGVQEPPEEIERIVLLAVECLRAQLVSPDEAKELEEEVEKALAVDYVSLYCITIK